MARLTSLLLLGAGALVLVTWLVAPASSAPPQAATAPVPAMPEIDRINHELDRLHARVAPQPGPRVVRDPFQYESQTITPSADSDADDTDAESSVRRPAVSWPRLVAILSSGNAIAPEHRAVFEDANGIIQILNAGEIMGGVRVDRITTDEVFVTATSVDEATSLSVR